MVARGASSSPRERGSTLRADAPATLDKHPDAAAVTAGGSGRSYSSILLAISNLGVFAFPFLRGVVLARLLSPADFGLAISITTMATVVDIISDVGLFQYAVRISSPGAIPTLHSVALIRAAILAAIMVLFSPLFASLFNAPGAASAYAVIGLSPLLRGFYHLNVKTAMRSFNFTKEAVTEFVGQLTWTIVSIGAALVFRDYWAMVIGVLVYWVVVIGMTHLLADFRWRLGWEWSVVRDVARFGRPLIPNGAATVLVNMGDRTLVGSFLGLDALASYSVLSTSAFLPRSALMRFVNAVMTPQFVNASTPERADRLLVISAVILSGIGGTFAFGYMAFGQPLIALVFGKHYAVAQAIVSLIAILSCIRFLATITTPVGIAKGDTGLIFLNTATQSLGLGLGLAFVHRNATLEAMVSGLCAGELIALLYIVSRLLRSHRASSAGVWLAVLPTLALVLGCGATIFLAGFDTVLPKFGVSAGFTVAELAALATVMSLNGISPRNVAGVFLPRRLQPTS